MQRDAPRRRERPGRKAIGFSVALHAVLLVVVIAGGLVARPAPIDFEVYRVDMVAAPADPTPDPVVEQAPAPEPEPQATAPEPEPEPVPEQPKPQPRREQPKQEPRQDTPEERPRETERPRSENTGRTGSEDITVQIEGLQARYPEYYENIIRQLTRFFRYSGQGRPSAEVFFYIRPDGSVADIRIVRSTNNMTFNLEAMGAVEQAGERRAFGPLPGDFQGERLPVLFSFEPPR